MTIVRVKDLWFSFLDTTHVCFQQDNLRCREKDKRYCPFSKKCPPCLHYLYDNLCRAYSDCVLSYLRIQNWNANDKIFWKNEETKEWNFLKKHDTTEYAHVLLCWTKEKLCVIINWSVSFLYHIGWNRWMLAFHKKKWTQFTYYNVLDLCFKKALGWVQFCHMEHMFK